MTMLCKPCELSSSRPISYVRTFLRVGHHLRSKQPLLPFDRSRPSIDHGDGLLGG